MSEITTLPLPKSRNLYLYEQVDQFSIKTLTQDIISINEDDRHLEKLYQIYGLNYAPLPIKIFIDSYGGAVDSMFGCCNIIESSLTPINTIVTGCAMSAAFLISISGRKRYCHHNSRLMYHQSIYFNYGKIEDLKQDMKENKRLEKSMIDYVSQRTKLTKKQLKDNDKLKKDWYFSSQEALEFGIVDEII